MLLTDLFLRYILIEIVQRSGRAALCNRFPVVHVEAGGSLSEGGHDLVIGLDGLHHDIEVFALQTVTIINRPLAPDTFPLTEPGRAIEPLDVWHQDQIDH